MTDRINSQERYQGDRYPNRLNGGQSKLEENHGHFRGNMVGVYMYAGVHAHGSRDAYYMQSSLIVYIRTTASACSDVPDP